MPVFYGAQSYDGILLIDSAVRAVKGNLANKKGMVAAMKKADFASTRGKFSYNSNHFPIQNFYLLKTVTGPAGQDPVMEIQKTVFTNHKDSYAKELRDEVIFHLHRIEAPGRGSLRAPFSLLFP